MKALNLISVANDYPNINKIKTLVDKNLPAKSGLYELAETLKIIENNYLLDIIHKQYKMKLGIRNTETNEIIIELDDDYTMVSDTCKLKTDVTQLELGLFKINVYLENNINKQNKKFILTPSNVLIVNERSFIYNLLKNKFMNTVIDEENLDLYKIDIIDKPKQNIYNLPDLFHILLTPTTINGSFDTEIDLLLTNIKSRAKIENITYTYNEISFDLFNVDISITIIKESDKTYTLNLTMQGFYRFEFNEKTFKTIDEVYDFIDKLIDHYNNYKQAKNNLIKFVK